MVTWGSPNLRTPHFGNRKQHAQAWAHLGDPQDREGTKGTEGTGSCEGPRLDEAHGFFNRHISKKHLG